jgi:phosphoserine phosphatase
MSSLGANSALVSGGFSFFADKVADDIGFDQAYANQLIFEGNILSGDLKNPILGATDKQIILQKLCTEGNFDLCDVIAVGDGANDIEMVTHSGIGVSYYGKEKLTEKSDFKLYYSNLRALLYFQGIKESEFVLK